jgi:SIR2-like protein
MSKPRMTVLVGSGASIEFGVSGVKDLTRALNDRTRADEYARYVGADAALDTIIAKLKTLYADPAEVNFERIYHVANRLMQHARNPDQALPEFKPILHPFMAALPPEFDERRLRALERAYVKHLFAIIAEESALADVSAIKTFVDQLQTAYLPRIYSLNYDDLFWRAAPDLLTGFGRVPGPNPFDGSTFFAQTDRAALFYLHGSIHISFAHPPRGDIGELFWFEEVDDAAKSSDFHGSSPGQADGTFIERSPLVTGLEKSASVLTAPFSYYFSELLRDLMTSDIILVIGYGLADPHVNAHLRLARTSPRQPRLVVIDYFDWMKVFANNSPWINNFSHTLHVALPDHLAAVPMGVGDWQAIKDGKAAVWNRGFKAFLASGVDAATIAARLA